MADVAFALTAIFVSFVLGGGGANVGGDIIDCCGVATEKPRDNVGRVIANMTITMLRAEVPTNLIVGLHLMGF